jgi:hypothetical protein
MFIPPGTTSRAQVLDVGINRPFKDAFKNAVLSWMVNNRESAKKIGREEISEFIILSWDKITSESIINTFRHIGFQ